MEGVVSATLGFLLLFAYMYGNHVSAYPYCNICYITYVTFACTFTPKAVVKWRHNPGLASCQDSS